MVTYVHQCHNIDANILMAFVRFTHDHLCKTISSTKAGGAGTVSLTTCKFMIKLAKVSDQQNTCQMSATSPTMLTVQDVAIQCGMTYLTITLQGRQSASTGDPPLGRLSACTLANASQTAGVTSNKSCCERLDSTFHPSSTASSSISTYRLS